MDKIFVPTQKVWVVITNGKYEVKRAEDGYSGFADLTEVEDDHRNALAGFKNLSDVKDEIIEHHDITRD